MIGPMQTLHWAAAPPFCTQLSALAVHNYAVAKDSSSRFVLFLVQKRQLRVQMRTPCNTIRSMECNYFVICTWNAILQSLNLITICYSVYTCPSIGLPVFHSLTSCKNITSHSVLERCMPYCSGYHHLYLYHLSLQKETYFMGYLGLGLELGLQLLCVREGSIAVL